MFWGQQYLYVPMKEEFCWGLTPIIDLLTPKLAKSLCLSSTCTAGTWVEKKGLCNSREISFEDLVTWRHIFSCAIWLPSFRYCALSST